MDCETALGRFACLTAREATMFEMSQNCRRRLNDVNVKLSECLQAIAKSERCGLPTDTLMRDKITLVRQRAVIKQELSARTSLERRLKRRPVQIEDGCDKERTTANTLICAHSKMAEWSQDHMLPMGLVHCPDCKMYTTLN
jgi:hypothetical protein